MPGQERRQYIRFDIDMDLRFQIANKASPDEEWFFGLCQNLSIEGLCMLCKEDIKEKSVLCMEISLPSRDETVRLKGEVCWSRPCLNDKGFKFEVGVNLFTISKNEETRFILFVCELMKLDLLRYIKAKPEEESEG